MLYSLANNGNTLTTYAIDFPETLCVGPLKIKRSDAEWLIRGYTLDARKGHIMSIAKKSMDPADTDTVKVILRGFNVNRNGENAARDLAACIVAVNYVGVGDQLMPSTVENASDPKTSGIKDVRIFIKAVLYRVMIEDGQYERGGKFYHAPRPAQKAPQHPQAVAA